MRSTPGNARYGAGAGSWPTSAHGLAERLEREAPAPAASRSASPSGRACDVRMNDCRARRAAATSAAEPVTTGPPVRRRRRPASGGVVGVGVASLAARLRAPSARSSRMRSIRSWCSTLSSNSKRSSGTRRSRTRLPICRRRNGVARSSACAVSLLRLLVADERVVHARQLQIGRDLHARERDEADAGIVDLARQQLR